MTEPDSDLPHQVALFRYGLIAELVRLPPGTPGLYRRLEAIAAQDYVIPGSTRTRVATETLRDWLKRYRDGGFEALLPKPRADRGTPRALRDLAEIKIHILLVYAAVFCVAPRVT